MALLGNGQPLQRRTALRRGVGLARSPQGLARGPLRARSAKTAELYATKRRPLVERLLAERPACEAALAGCTGASSEIHEVKSRGRGGSIIDEDNCRALCHSCHAFITDHPLVAAMEGFLIHSWEELDKTDS